MSSEIPPPPSKKVPYVRLGKSGLKVSKVILGCMTYGAEWADWLLGEEEAIKHIKYAYDAGIQTFDTAPVYSNGLSEIILGKAIKQLNLPREELVIMTKFGGPVSRIRGEKIRDLRKADMDGYVNQYGMGRKYIYASLDYIDVLQCHRLEPGGTMEEMMQALHELVQQGLVRYIGMSSCYAWEFHVMQNYAITHGLTPFISMQNHHSLIYREEEREMFPTLKHFSVSAIPWSSLGRGLLCRPFKKQNETKRGETDWFLVNYGNDPSLETTINRVEEISKTRGISMAQVTLAWECSKDVVAAPIIGTTSLNNLKDIIEGLDVKLTKEEIEYLEEPYRPMKIVGH
ncbi:Aldo keto reductase [Lentinus tigrinus ALCF2SS1-6]|uniref:Aldo keto reductase n=1 Tax=Lentinus tigrinus ALCF2SS1-6 TaxID=1328759 RepID=A0A5C2SVF4_9APHY|nr:Aldo keto reductase [Lentinus tigrinus ALCF2SS1-6]